MHTAALDVGHRLLGRGNGMRKVSIQLRRRRAEAAVAQEAEADLGADVAANAGDGDKPRTPHGGAADDNSIRDEGATAMGNALAVNASLKLKKLVVPFGLEKNAQLVAACRAKGVELE